MADETKQTPDVAEETPQAEPQPETDWQAEAEKWKAQSREWEKRSKANKAAADELEQLKAAQMTEQEKAVARAEKAEAELAKMVAKSEHDEAAKRVSEKSGVPLKLLDYLPDEEAMTAFAEEWAASQQPVHSAPSANGSRIVREGSTQTSADVFADAIQPLFKH